MTEVHCLLAGGPLNGGVCSITIPDDSPGDGRMLFPDPTGQPGAHHVYRRIAAEDPTQPWVFRFDPTHIVVIPNAPHPSNN